MHGASFSLSSDLIHFTTSLLISLVLLVLTLRAARLPGTPLANSMFALDGVFWSVGGLTRVLLLSAGMAKTAHWAVLAQALQYTGAACFPAAILLVWRPFAHRPWQRTASRILQVCSAVTGGILTGLLWSGLVAQRPVIRATAYNAAILLALGAALLLRRESTPRTVFLPSVATVAALCIAVLMSLHGATGLAAHFILLMALATFLLFARFRFADLFIRYTLRILLAAVWAGILAGITTAPVAWEVVHRARFPDSIHGFLLVLAVNGLLFSFIWVDERVAKSVNRWLFRAPDYRAETRALAARLRELDDDAQIAVALEDAARRPLELSVARVELLDPAAWPAGLAEGETVERGGEVLIPVPIGTRFPQLLRVAPGPARPGLVSHDLDYLRSLAALSGNRLAELVRERENIQRQSREALLLQQVTEAELRALRAQINPHFLFNSLNTVADLIVRDPARAEVMTLRLASVFRHLLAHSSRPLTTIREEIEFLRTYLHIEEARFGDRLSVEFAVDPAAEEEAVPSLILQPLVENALKHGLGPKPGPGHLRIAVNLEGEQVRIEVEDDGMGLAGREESRGTGLANVADRLTTLYQDRAGIRLEARAGGGCRVTLLVPRGKVMTE